MIFLHSDRKNCINIVSFILQRVLPISIGKEYTMKALKRILVCSSQSSMLLFSP